MSRREEPEAFASMSNLKTTESGGLASEVYRKANAEGLDGEWWRVHGNSQQQPSELLLFINLQSAFLWFISLSPHREIREATVLFPCLID